jgi:beta-glucanase (GH16 family)
MVNGGTLDVWGRDGPSECTSNANYGCLRTSNGQSIINPIQSAKVISKEFSLRYGRVEVKARLPRGDWIWPGNLLIFYIIAIWLLPKHNAYGGWPASGEIDIMESRGNGPDYSEGGYDELGSTLHWGTSWLYNKFSITHATAKIDMSREFHTFSMVFTSAKLM